MEISRLRLVFGLIIAILTVLWLLSAGALGERAWANGHVLIYYTGVIAMGLMSIGVMLAARPVQIEGVLGGLDKFYRLHKWLGVGALLVGVGHWLVGSITHPEGLGEGRGPGGGLAALSELRGPAAELAEWTLFLLIALVALALWKRFPYRYFLKTHRLMAAAYLVLVFHAVVMMPRGFWIAPIGLVMAVLLAGGSVAAFASLFRRIGHSRRATGAVTSLHPHTGEAVLDVGVRLDTAWPGHEAGQFAFVTFDRREGAHPFTIASAWRGDGELLFSVKGLGDYTRQLPDSLRVGQAVTIEGPYGRFDFHGGRDRQVWIGGGVGITPFVARLAALAETGNKARVDLVYCASTTDASFTEKIRKLAEKAHVELHVLLSPQQGLLTLDRLAQMVPEWARAEIWFCGPAGFGQSLRAAMTRRGFSHAHFHQELFEMR